MSTLNPAAVRTMIVDDDPFMLKLLQRMLARLGYDQVDCFDCGRMALERLTAAPRSWQVIVLDVQMPEMDGVEFIRRLAEQRYRGGIILVSGEANRILQGVEKLIESHHLNALGFLQKPVKPADLAALLGKARAEDEVADAAVVRHPFGDAAQVRAALARGEFVNHYQPKVSLASCELVGVECLVRWQHPVAGLVYPDAFIALVEACGLITELSRAVLRGAFQQARAWLQGGHEVPVAVNVTMSDLTALDFPDRAADMARAAGIDPALITLEVTESQMMQELSTVLEVVTRLELKRFRLAIDDFGTGHSSLAQLRDLPFDELKLDRSFVHGAADNATRRAICSASLRMAHQLNLKVVAEGIEDEADWEFLQQLGCDVGQGYFIARPMPASELVPWLNAWQARLKASNPQTA